MRLLLMLLLPSALVLTGCGQSEAERAAEDAAGQERIEEAMGRSDPETRPQPTVASVLYEAQSASGVTYADVTIETPTGTSQQTIELPLRPASSSGITEGLAFSFDRGDFVYISVQNKQDSGSVTCRITVEGDVISENTSTGAYVIASCDGSVP